MKCKAYGTCPHPANPKLVAYEEDSDKLFPCCDDCWELGWDVPVYPEDKAEVDYGD